MHTQRTEEQHTLNKHRVGKHKKEGSSSLMNLGSVDIYQIGRDVVSFSPVTGDSLTCRLCLLYLEATR
jgi:hypothetical protein